MYIYHLKIKNSTCINHVVEGDFSGSSGSDIVISRGSVLELLHVEDNGTLSSLCTQDLHMTIRSICKMMGDPQDYLIVASDSGSVLMMQYSEDQNTFLSFFRQAYGRPGYDRFVPGEFLAGCPWKNAFALSAQEEYRIFYGFAVQKAAKDIKPAEVSEPRCITYDFVGIDSDYPNPIYASLEAEYKKGTTSPDESIQELKFYEHDRTANKATLMEAFPLDSHANMLISVPMGECHPPGVFVCFDVKIVFQSADDDYPSISCLIPQRQNDAFNMKRGFLLTSSATHITEEDQMILVQSEQGDLFSIHIEMPEDETEPVIKMLYMDTIPVASAMCIVGGAEFLFVAADFGDHFLYRIKSLGSERETVRFRKSMLYMFAARKLENLEIVSKLEGVTPVVQSLASDLACNNLKKFYFACGRSYFSTLRSYRYGVKVSLLFETECPPFANAIWAVTMTGNDRVDTFIIVSLLNDTVVYSVNDRIERTKDDDVFKRNSPTLICSQCTPTSFIQIYRRSIRYVFYGVPKWVISKCKFNDDIVECAVYGTQVAVSFDNRDMFYIEIEELGEEVRFPEKKKHFRFPIMCMKFVPGEPKAKHLVICFEDSLSIYSVSRDEEIKTIMKHSIDRIPVSLEILPSQVFEFHTVLSIGFHDGHLQRIAISEGSVLKSPYSVKLGDIPVKQLKTSFQGKPAILALSNKAWISFFHPEGLPTLVPLDTEKLDAAAAIFPTVHFPEANVLAFSGKRLLMLSVNSCPTMIEDDRLALTYTPTMVTVNPRNKYIIIAETEMRALYHKQGEMNPKTAMDLALEEAKKLEAAKQREAAKQLEATKELEEDESSEAENVDEAGWEDVETSSDEEEEKKPPPPKPKIKASMWDSVLHIFDPVEKETLFKQPLSVNEAAVSMSLMQFDEHSAVYLLVGIKQDLMIVPKLRQTYVHTYKMSDDGKSFTFVHKADVDDVPSAIRQIGSYVIIGVENLLCLYRFVEETQILTLCDTQEFKLPILDIWTREKLFIVKTDDERLTYGYLKDDDVSLAILHKDRYMRAVTCLCFWDEDVMFVADRTRRITSILLPNYPGCHKLPPVPDNPDSIIDQLMNLNIEDDEAGPSTSSQAGPLGAQAGPSGAQAGPSGAQAGPSGTQAGLSTSSQAGPSGAQAGSSGAQAGPSGQEAGPRRAKSSKFKHPEPTTSQMRFMQNSYSIVTCHVEGIVKSLEKTSLMDGGRELILYTTITGVVGVIVPFLNEMHHKFFGPLEYLLLNVSPIHFGDDTVQLDFKKNSYEHYHDTQYVIDGNLCDLYYTTVKKDQLSIAECLGASTHEVSQKLEEMKTTLYFTK